MEYIVARDQGFPIDNPTQKQGEVVELSAQDAQDAVAHGYLIPADPKDKRFDEAMARSVVAFREKKAADAKRIADEAAREKKERDDAEQKRVAADEEARRNPPKDTREEAVAALLNTSAPAAPQTPPPPAPPASQPPTADAPAGSNEPTSTETPKKK